MQQTVEQTNEESNRTGTTTQQQQTSEVEDSASTSSIEISGVEEDDNDSLEFDFNLEEQN